ncbi:MAG: M48 family metallopeptidase [Eubacteriales bacterium]|nr:M48 family metallopeptidase [Eubacteriales bacterium]
MQNMTEYTLIRSRRRKSISVNVDEKGTVVVRAPYFITRFQIESFLNANRPWIEKRRALMLAEQSKYPPLKGVHGERLLYLGEWITLDTGHVRRSALRDGVLYVPGKDPLSEIEKWYRSEAMRIMTELTAKYASAMGMSYSRVGITSAKTRFGSCSGRDSINYTFRLVMFPPKCIKYVAVHELCHTRQKNHSAAFWALVARAVPDYAEIKRWMDENSAIMNMI